MLSQSLIIVILSIVVVLDLGFGAVIFFLDRRSPVNQLFSLWMIALGTWTLTLVGFFSTPSDAMALFWMRGAYAAAIVAVLAFWYFASQFPWPTTLLRSVHLGNFAALGVFLYAVMGTPLIVRAVVGGQDRSVFLNSVGWYVYAVYLLYFFLTAHVMLFGKFLKAAGMVRVQLKYVVASVFVGGEIFGVFFNLILPSPVLNQWRYIWIGPLATTAIIVPAVAYAITKHNLLNVKGILTEALVAYSIIFALVDVFTFDSAPELLVRSVFALGVAGLGAILIVRVNADERRRRELQDLTRKLSVANAKLKELDALKSEFVSIASHQLRTPISVMKGYLSLIMENAYGQVGGQLRDKVEQMYTMNERLVRLINNMLNVSRIEKKKIEFSCEPVDVRGIVAQVAAELSLKAKQKGLGLIYADPPAEPAIAHVDKEKLHEVLSNLVDNAIKYSSRGAVELRVAPERRDGRVVVTVKDQGIGMTPDEARRLFKKFYRTKEAAASKEAGTGLGLYICDTFMRGMGGECKIQETAPGKGTTMALLLPVSPKGTCARPSAEK